MASQAIIANQRAAGGGSSGPDISGATATPEQVLEGYTFFAGETTEMQTGTLNISDRVVTTTGSVTPRSSTREQRITIPHNVTACYVEVVDSNGTYASWWTYRLSDSSFVVVTSGRQFGDIGTTNPYPHVSLSDGEDGAILTVYFYASSSRSCTFNYYAHGYQV